MIQLLLILLVAGIGIYTVYSLTRTTQPTTTTTTTTTTILPTTTTTPNGTLEPTTTTTILPTTTTTPNGTLEPTTTTTILPTTTTTKLIEPLTFVYKDITNDTIIALPIRVIDINNPISINWGDDKIETFTTDYPSRQYNTNTQVTIKVTGGSFTHFGNDTTTHLSGINKLVEVSSWGSYMFTSMLRAFFGATNLTYVPNIIPSSVTNTSQMFYGAQNFNGDISSWDTGNVTTMSGMFRDAFNFTGDISKWNISNVTNTSFMFYNARNFNSNITTKTINDKIYWDTSKVTNMRSMFFNATKFNQNIGGWNIGNVINMETMFSGTIYTTTTRPVLSVENYSAILIGWAENALQNNITINSITTKLSFTAVTKTTNLTATAQIYKSAETAYNNLKDTKGWTFNPEPEIISTPTTTTVLQFTNNEPMRNSIKIEGYNNNKLLYYAKYIK
jgi:surface protein